MMEIDLATDVSETISDDGSFSTILSARLNKDVEEESVIVPSMIELSKECKRDAVTAFNSSFDEFLQTKADRTLDEMSRCLVLLGTSPTVSQFEPENVEIATLFNNVYKLLSTIESRSLLLWSALSFVEQASQNCSARVALVRKFKYMEILSKLLDTLNNSDRILRVLKLLESLTYGIKITWQEPYLKDLIKTLVNYVTRENEPLIVPALSILINLCYKNLPPVYLLLRCIKPEELLSKIEHHGILACKISLLLENNLDGATEEDISSFVMFTFSEIHRALRSFNPGLLRHTVEFFADMKANRAICMHFQGYDNYLEDVQCILQYITDVDNSPDYDVDVVKEAKRCWPRSISLLFEFLVNVIDLKAEELKKLFPNIAACALKWIISEKAGTNSLILLTSLINKDDKFEYLSTIIEDLAKSVGNALQVAETINPSSQQISALLKLLGVLFKQEPITDELSSLARKFIFEFIFGELISKYHGNNTIVPVVLQTEVCLYIRALGILADLASWSTDYSWKSGLDNLMRSPVIQFVIAKAVLCDDAETCSLVFQLAQVSSFPVHEISEKIVKQGPTLLARSVYPETLQESSCSFDSLPSNLTSFSTEQRINDLIDRISAAQKSNQIGNVLMSDIMELFEYKINMCTNEERDLLTKLNECNSQITDLSQKHTLLSAEVSRYQSLNFTLQMKIDRLQDTVAAQIEENKHLMKTLKYYEMSLTAENSNQFELISQIEFKNSEIRELNNQLIAAKKGLIEREEELKRLQELVTTERRQNIDLEECVKTLETLRDELQMKIVQQEKSIRDNTEEILLLEKENNSLEDQVKKAECALQEKTNLLKHYAQDLRDVEEMRTRVVSIMNRKGVPS